MSSYANLIAVRYVRALFETAAEKKQHEQVKKDMLALRAVIAKSPELRRFFVNPVISRAQAEKAMDAVLTAIRAGELTRQFFALLAKQRRLAVTPAVIEKYLAQLAQERGELVVHVVSASAFGKKQVEFLSGVLAGTTGKKVELQLSENSELIGGVQIRIGSRMLDNSISSKLSRLRLALSKAA